ncbi:MAG: SWIM zinc finger family protein [Lachnospiraceae bacterium]|nr:SWIM zinc finger family protein [Lachnospiraceae bacterium]
MKKSYWDTESLYEQPSASQIKRNAGETARKAKAKGTILHPVKVDGRRITHSWWGSAWCENLERYADYENRLERGRRYLRTGAVVDLQIAKGKVMAKVQGRKKTPYKVEIRISPVNENRMQHIMDVCGDQIDSLERLLEGDFPEELKEVFWEEGGLFPTPKEISFNCSCPDWALMCKHVAAVLYGIAVRFDEDPLLFFLLRGIDVDRFVQVTLENSVESMLANMDVVSDRIITSDDWEKLFGVL